MSSIERLQVIKTYFQIQVENLDRAKKWYEDILGLDSLFFASEVGWGEMQLPGGDPKLGLNLTDKTPEGNWGKLMLEVEDIYEAKKFMEAKGVDTSEITTVPEMVSYFDIKDSERNGIQIVSTPD